MVTFSQYTTVVRIDSSVTSIPPEAFKDRNDLVEVELPEGLQEIGEEAFRGCISLRKINLVDGLREVGPHAFHGCTALTEVEIPSTVTIIAGGAFSYCTSLLRIDIPTTVTSIGEYAFYGCSSLKEVNLRDGLQVICGAAFRECTALLCIDIPSTVTSIRQSAFYACTSLKVVELHDGIQVLGEWVFGQCTSLRRVDIPSTVISIEDAAFDYCSSLNEVNLRDGLQEIGSYAFRGCTSLLRIEIPASVGVIGNEAFEGCRFLRNIVISPSSEFAYYEVDTDPMFESIWEVDCTMEMIIARFDDLPIHRLCFYHSHEETPNTRTLLEALVAQCVDQWAGVDVLGMTPLHVLACSGSHDLDLYEYLIGCYPESMTIKDEWGETPLDYILLSEAPNKVIQFFLRSHSERSNVAPFDVGKTIQRCKSGVFLKNLIKAQRTSFPELVIDWQSITDESVRRNAPLGVYGVLVQASISPRFNRMISEHQLEVDSRRRGIAPEQYADIWMFITKYTHHSQEVTTAIELAVWKAKFYELFFENNGNEHHQIRSNSYIQSGKVCVVVIPLVLSFL